MCIFEMGTFLNEDHGIWSEMGTFLKKIMEFDLKWVQFFNGDHGI